MAHKQSSIIKKNWKQHQVLILHVTIAADAFIWHLKIRAQIFAILCADFASY